MMCIFIHRVKERDHAHEEKSQNKLKETAILYLTVMLLINQTGGIVIFHAASDEA